MTISSITSSFVGPRISRESSTTFDGEGVKNKKVAIEASKGAKFSRERTRTIAEDGAVTVSKSASLTKADGTTYTRSATRTVSADRQTAEVSITGPKGNTRNYTFSRVEGGGITVDNNADLVTTQPISVDEYA